MIDCSEAQITPLSKVLLVMISFTAWWISALRSINAGPLPGPPLMVGCRTRRPRAHHALAAGGEDQRNVFAVHQL